MLVDGERVSASLFDFGLYFFHNAKQVGNEQGACSMAALVHPKIIPGQARIGVAIKSQWPGMLIACQIYNWHAHDSICLT